MDLTRNAVVVGMYGRDSLPALFHAIAEAERTESRLLIVHAQRQRSGRRPTTVLEYLKVRRAGEDLLAGAAMTAKRHTAAHLDVETQLVIGAARLRLAEATSGSRLIVIGRRRFGWARDSFGLGVAPWLSHHSSCPVVIVSDDPSSAADTSTHGPVVIVVDRAVNEVAVLRAGFAAAQVDGLPVSIVHRFSPNERQRDVDAREERYTVQTELLRAAFPDVARVEHYLDDTTSGPAHRAFPEASVFVTSGGLGGRASTYGWSAQLQDLLDGSSRPVMVIPESLSLVRDSSAITRPLATS